MPEADEDLQTIADDNFGRAERLIKAIDKLLLAQPSKHAIRIPDPPAVPGPRYFMNVREGYGVVFRVLEASHDSGAGPAMRIERVMTMAQLQRALLDEDPC